MDNRKVAGGIEAGARMKSKASDQTAAVGVKP